MVIGLTSCGEANLATKKFTFDKANRSIQSQMESQGFELIAHDSEEKGIKNYIRKDTYHFADSLGNAMDYSVNYKTQDDYVYAVELCGCKTSNPNDFERFCGDDGVSKPIKELPQDQEITMGMRLSALAGVALYIAILNAPLLLEIALFSILP